MITRTATVRTCKYGLFLIVSVFLCLEAGLWVSRFVPKLEREILEKRSASMLVGILKGCIEPDRLLFWRLKPNLETAALLTNAHGYRCPEILKSKPSLRVLAIGDSCTYGLGVPYEDSWPGQLQLALNALKGEGACEVVNTGVPGYSSFQGLRMLQAAAPTLQPDMVIWGLGINDSAWWLGVSDMHMAALLELTGAEKLAGWSNLYRFLRLRRKLATLEEPAKNIFEVAARMMAERRPRLHPEEYEANLRAAQAYCESRGMDFIVVSFPMVSQVLKPEEDPFATWTPKYARYQETMRKTAEESGAAFVDLLDVFSEALPEKLFYDNSIHPNKAGYALTTEAILDKMKSLDATLMNAEPLAPNVREHSLE